MTSIIVQWQNTPLKYPRSVRPNNKIRGVSSWYIFKFWNFKLLPNISPYINKSGEEESIFDNDDVDEDRSDERFSDYEDEADCDSDGFSDDDDEESYYNDLNGEQWGRGIYCESVNWGPA